MNQFPDFHQYVEASYIAQSIPHFIGNPLIEALPPPMSDESLVEALSLEPSFDISQQAWPTSERMMMIESLQNFMVPMTRHIELCRAIDALLRAGYVGRAPRTPGHSAISQSIYQNQMMGKSFAQAANSRTPQLSTALIGVSGMGKTTTVQRWCAHLPKVIFHRELNLYQIPVLHVEMPSDGSSIKGLAHGILQKIDQLIPGANYYDMYAQKGRTGADTLMRGVARVMNLHLVGLLICDEVQNLANSRKGSQTVMTELVSAANDLKVPILFIGTMKAAKVLGTDFRQSRRSSGHGIEPWQRLPKGDVKQPSEWDAFVQVLWKYQWVRNPVPLDHLLSHCIYECTQGVIDLAIKLFSAAQFRAMLDGSETLSSDLLLDVYKKEFQLMHPMIDALREDNYELLNQFEDIAPINFQQHLEASKSKVRALSSPLFTVKASDESFQPRISAALQSFGMSEEDSITMASSAAERNPEATLAQGLSLVAASISKPKSTRPSPKSKVVIPIDSARFDDRPNDYRRAIAYAQKNTTSVLEQLKAFGMAPSIEDVLAI